MVEGARLESVYAPKAHQEFESLTLRLLYKYLVIKHLCEDK